MLFIVGALADAAPDESAPAAENQPIAAVTTSDDSPEPTTEPTTEETSEPTDDPTTEPTTEETSEPTDDPTTEETPEPTEETPEPTEETPEPTEEPREPKLWAVTRVIDGDTVEVAYKGRAEPIRVIGIDTPETVDPNTPVECWGPRASSEAERLLGGEQVQLVFDPSQGRRDTYDRLLAYVVIPGVGDFGEVMIRRGNAAEYTYDIAYARQGTYRSAEQDARRTNRGLWKECGGVDTPLATTPPPTTAPPTEQPTTEPPPGGGCAPGYDPCVPPYPPDVDCDDVDGPITITGDDPHGLDSDDDGVGCES